MSCFRTMNCISHDTTNTGVILQTPVITNVAALVDEVSDVTAVVDEVSDVTTVVVWRDDPMRF